jgi:uncharacterized membrane protein
MEALDEVESIPTWATVSGTIENLQGKGPGMTYEWHYYINNVRFNGQSEVLEQTDTTLITKTMGDVDSIWTINLSPAGKKSTALSVVVEYSPPNIYVEILADIVLQQIQDPKVARENITRFKQMVEARVKVREEEVLSNQ